jgi:IclR family transcriptional regulator, KDG regulon repressor
VIEMTEMPDSGQIAYSAPIVSKALKVLKLIIMAPKNPGISEIAQALSLAKSTTHGILAALEATGWVIRDPITRKYTAGHAIRDLATNAFVRISFMEQARPLLEKLVSEIDEDLFIGISTGQKIMILDQVESTREVKIRAKPGTRISQFAGAAGKVFWAFEDPETVSEILKTTTPPNYTPKSITDPDAYMKELEKVRNMGVAIDIEEYMPNVWGVGVPVFYGKKNRKRIVSAFWIVGMSTGDSPERIRRAVEHGKATGEAISRAISSNSE